MFTSKQYRSEASRFRDRADQASRSADKEEFRSLERSFDTLADNAEWIAVNGKRIVPPSQDGRTNAELAPEEDHILRCLGASLIMRWNTLPTKLQRELFETVGEIGDVIAMPDLRGRIARFLHTHKDGDKGT
jgi:hypothetical protein